MTDKTMTKKEGHVATVCTHCAEYISDKRATAFVIDGVKHSAPDMWLAARSEHRSFGVQGVFDAMHDWAACCQLVKSYKQQ